MHRKIATILTAASLLAAVPLANAHAYYWGGNTGHANYATQYSSGSGATQGPSQYTRGGSIYGGGNYVTIDTSTNITRKHGSDYYAREYALSRIRNARTQAPCGQYTRKPLGCKFSTLSYRQYEAMNR